MEKFFYYNDLFSIYKELLTIKEQEIFSSYYEENLSMGEIADLRHISRSAIGSTIKKVEKKLDQLEMILKIKEKNNKILNICDRIKNENLKEELLNIIK